MKPTVVAGLIVPAVLLPLLAVVLSARQLPAAAKVIGVATFLVVALGGLVVAGSKLHA